MLFMFQKMFLGPVTKKKNEELKDLNRRELLYLVPLLVFIFWIGLYPKPFFGLMGPAVDNLVALIDTAAVTVLP
jgi:NADH-quinone oxidoreductase subunit M